MHSKVSVAAASSGSVSSGSVSSGSGEQAGYCPARELFEILSSKWVIRTLLILDAEHAVRYSAIRKQLPGISHKMMAQTLRTLQRDGFISRHATASIPPRVEHSLEPMGREVLAIVYQFKTWTEDNVERVRDHRERNTAEESAS